MLTNKLRLSRAPTARPGRVAGVAPCRTTRSRFSLHKVQSYRMSSIDDGNKGPERNTSRTDSEEEDAITMATIDVTPLPGTPQPVPVDEELESQKLARRHGRRVRTLKLQLLGALSSLDRGLAASARAAAEVDDLCRTLEGLAGSVAPLSPPRVGAAIPSTSEPDLLAGTWRLVYSSGFNTGSLGGRRPGPPAVLVPASLGQVYQRIDPQTGKLDNIVELLLAIGMPRLPSLDDMTGLLNNAMATLSGPSSSSGSSGSSPFGSSGPSGSPVVGTGSSAARRIDRDSPAIRLTLRHDYELVGSTGVRIIYEETFGQALGLPLVGNLPQIAAPQLPDVLKPPKNFRSATFEVVYLDPQLRITRGDRGELRVYLRDDGAQLDTAMDGANAGSGGMATLSQWDIEDIESD